MVAMTRCALVAAFGVALFFINPLSNLAVTYNDAVFKAGLAIYASLRGLTSVLSIVRDMDLQASIGVASVATSPGEALQPVISTIERMANLMFALVIASGVLTATLPIVAKFGAVLLAAGAGAKALALAMRRPLAGGADRLARSMVTLGVVAAVCIPVAYGLASILGDHSTSAAWKQAEQVFEQQADALSVDEFAGLKVAASAEPEEPETLEEGQPSEDGNFVDWAQEKLGGAVQQSGKAVKDALDAATSFANAVRDRAAASATVVTHGLEMAEGLFEASVNIGVAYLLKLVVLPLLILSGILWLLRSLTRDGPIPREEFRSPSVVQPPASESDNNRQSSVQREADRL